MSAWGASSHPAKAPVAVEAVDDDVTEEAASLALAEKQAAEKEDIFELFEPVQTVSIEGVALLQIIKHCHEKFPTCVTGSLLGLEQNNILEVTNSFPSPVALSTTKSNQRELDDYQIGMMKHLREVGMDNNRVGWYQSVLMGSFVSESVIESQFQYQKSLGPNAICLFYDAIETKKGNLSVKAFRLKKSFYDSYKAGVYANKSSLKEEYRPTDIFDEISVRIYNPELIQCYVQQLALHNHSIANNSWDQLNLSSASYLETSMKNISAWADELGQEQFKLQNYERNLIKHRTAYQQWQARQREDEHASEKEPDYFKYTNQPSRLEFLLITKQMQVYCDQINRHAGISIPKLLLASKLHSKE